MNVIPKVNGKVYLADDVLVKATEPLLFQDDSIPAEGYKLAITPVGTTIAASTEAGFFYGKVTLKAMVEEGKGFLLTGTIEDAPRFSHRGLMLDVSRHFFGVKEVKKVLDGMALLKLNRFHWHLSDDQGYRIESKVFPKLNEVGSWRTEKDGTTYGGYYTQEEIREIVAYAAERQIMVIPEIDLPGHTSAITASYPELSCDHQPDTVKCEGGIYPHILCGGDEKVYEFLYALLDEVVDLFPSPYFHLGGDEAPKSEWKKCEKCQTLIQKENLKDEEGLQAYFTKKLVEHLAKKGKTAIGWNEILKSEMALASEGGEAEPADATEETPAVPAPICQYWAETGAPYVYPHVAKGQKFIFSNIPGFYLDYAHSMVTLRAGYYLDPNILGNFDIPEEQILGFEGALWAERVYNPLILERQLFPRLLAIAENAWSDPSTKDYDEFIRRVKAYETTLYKTGLVFTPLEEADLHGLKRIRQLGKDAAKMKEAFAGEDGNVDVSIPPETKKELAESGKKMFQSFFEKNYRKP